LAQIDEQVKSINAANLEELAEDFVRRMLAPKDELPIVYTPKKSALNIVGFIFGCLTVALAVFFGLSYLEKSSLADQPEQVAIILADQFDSPPLRELKPNPVAGLLQFRGNPTHTYYGQGPVPRDPKLLWRFPSKPMCSESSVAGESKIWCGTGWTGQPVIWDRPDGSSEVIVGAFDRAVHFIDLETGKRTRPDFMTGDIIKGSVSLDPDGDPLLYFGSRDNKLRIVALDRKRPKEMWHLNANFVPGIWNNDWDGNPVVLNDILYEGGENGYLFAFRLHRDYDRAGLIRVRPELLVAIRGWNEELLRKVGDRNVSIENSVAIYKDRLYFANSAGRVVGVDISNVHAGQAPIVFDFWMGDDIDASIVIDEEGMLYVSAELERYLPRSDELGQLVKLNPYKPKDPLIWGLKIPPALDDFKGGLWSTPALDDDVLYITTHSGLLAVVDRNSGRMLFTDYLGPHAWSSPVLIDENLIVTTCKGEIRNYSVEDPARPILQWTVKIPTEACIESTPAVWNGRIVVGARDGYIYAFGDKP